jgi:hypothetical protein
MNTIHHALATLSVACLLVGCAATRATSESAPPPAASAPAMPSSTEDSAAVGESEPATLAEAEALLEKARADLDRLALNEPRSESAASGGAPAPAPAAATPGAAQPSEAKKERAQKAAEAADRADAETEAPTACETACKAFSSLTRASDAVCRLDAEGGQRCQRARQIQGDASRRVASCGCSK